jgi:predicted metal-dependent hydrolase
MQKAHTFFKKRIKKYSKELRVEPSQILIKNLRNRWGSTTKDNVINLNVNLLKTPSDVIDYMVLHELCHLKIKEHSYHFWDLLHKFMPNYQVKVEWLNANAMSLM